MQDGRGDVAIIIAIIPAKEESNRLPDKNILEIDGEPLLSHAIRYARQSRRIDGIYVSTDSDAIAACARNMGAGVIRRGSDLGGDTPLLDVFRHAWKQIDDARITHVVGIQPDHPDRKTDLDQAIDYALENGIDELFTVDRHGRRNGALRIMTVLSLESQPPVWSATLMDDCTNIHTPLDFEIAKRNLSTRVGTIMVGNTGIGEQGPVFVVAEAAGNHMCQMAMAEKMIDLAAAAGADAIKFQTYKAERLATKEATSFWAGKQISQVEHYRQLDKFGEEEYAHLFRYAHGKGIIGFSTPFDLDSASMLHTLGMPLFKVASCDLPDKRFLRHVAGFGKPIILSTGACTPEEIDEAVATIYATGNYQLVLLACTLSYPTKNEDANLRRIRSLKERYPEIVIGLSDHTEPDENMAIPAIAVALGARVIEKHYTPDRSLTGSSHFFSASPEDLKKMVANIRLAEKVLGSGDLGVLSAEEAARAGARRSVVAAKEIRVGNTITSDMIDMKRPGGGLSPSMIDAVLGKRARRDIEPDEQISLDMLEGGSIT